jgi:hypothetical protein
MINDKLTYEEYKMLAIEEGSRWEWEIELGYKYYVALYEKDKDQIDKIANQLNWNAYLVAQGRLN